ncbi:MAG: hypothetical protein QM736_09010 [Vicinamibacterales bacterium]
MRIWTGVGLVATLFVSAPLSAAVDDPRLRYEQVVELDTNGGASVRTNITVITGTVDVFILPVDAGTPDQVSASGHAVSLTWDDGGRRLLLTPAERAAAGAGITVTFHLSALSGAASSGSVESRTFYRFTNTTGAAIERYRVELVLPSAHVFHSADSTDAHDRTNVAQLISYGSRHALLLEDDLSTPGSRITLNATHHREAHAPFVLPSLVLISLAYLIAFRDLPRKKP